MAEHRCADPGELMPDWPRDFQRAGPQRLELELGPGRGHFALDHCALHSDIDLLAIETRRSDVEQLRARALKRGLTNLIVLQGDARLLLPRIFVEGQLTGVHIHCPDPWWKTRHHKRRLVDVELAALLRKLLAPGGEVDFRTDVPAYGREALQTWEDAGYENLAGAGQLATDAPEVLSTRERRYAQTGQPMFRMRLRNPLEARPSTAEGSMRTGREWRDVRRR
jgi:tRNA (guanine-N7-)-methyltransferase